MYLALNYNQHTFTATVINPESGDKIYTHAVDFDDDLPHRETQHGLLSGNNSGEYGIDPQMLVEALELLLETLQDSQIVDLSEVTHITGSATPSTIFLKKSFVQNIGELNPNLCIIDQIRSVYTTRFSPSLYDSSASTHANKVKQSYLEKYEQDTRSITGRAFNSATAAAQIHKFQHESEQAWEETEYIHTSSSFLLSILTGKNAPLDITDSSYFCLYNLHEKRWQEDLISEVNEDTLRKLPSIHDSEEAVNSISQYFCAKYGFSEDTKCLSWISQKASNTLGRNLMNSGDSGLELNRKYIYTLVSKEIPKTIPTLATVTHHPIAGFISEMVLENGLKSFITTLSRLGINHNDINSHLITVPSLTQHPPKLPFVEAEKALLIPAAEQKDSTLMSFTRGQILHIKLYSMWIETLPNKIYISGKAAVLDSLRQMCSNVFQINSIEIDDENANTKGQVICCDIEQDISKKDIFYKHHNSIIKSRTSPEPFMASIYSEHLNQYHQLLYNHINNTATTF